MWKAPRIIFGLSQALSIGKVYLLFGRFGYVTARCFAPVCCGLAFRALRCFARAWNEDGLVTSFVSLALLGKSSCGFSCFR